MKEKILDLKYQSNFWKEKELNSRLDLLVKIPTLEYLGDIRKKRILDIGCGTGKFCRMLAKKGAIVTGVDLLEKNLKIAKTIEPALKIKYLKRDLFSKNLNLNEKYDIIITHLVHVYAKEKKFLNSFKKIAKYLKNNGIYIYAGTHPCRVFFNEKSRWVRTYHNPNKIDYFNKNTLLPIDLISIKGNVFQSNDFHHTFSETINAIISANLIIQKVIEPRPTKRMIKKFSQFKDEKRLPVFLIIVAKKIHSS